MDLSDPTRSVTPTLDGTVLAVLATAGRPLSVGQVAAQAARGSEIGIRRSLHRLVEQGTVRATQMGRNLVHELNRDHVAAQVAVSLAGLRNDLWARFRTDLESWRPRAVYACVFGSAARGDGSLASDIDLLVVHPPFASEMLPTGGNAAVLAQLVEGIAGAILAATDPDAEARWERQLDQLHEQVETWTGNPLQIVDVSVEEWLHPSAQHRALFDEVDRDGIEVVKAQGFPHRPATKATHG